MKKRLIAVAIALILLAMLSHAQEDEGPESGCCCDPAGRAQQNTFLTSEECVAPYFFTSIDTIMSDQGLTEDDIRAQVETEVICDFFCQPSAPPLPPPVVLEPCEDPTYNPAPSDLAIIPVNGEKKFELTWNYVCKPDYYNIYRCEGAGCDPLADGTMLRELVTVTYFEDSDETYYQEQAEKPRWNQDYTYAVEAVYNKQGAEASKNHTTLTANLGDIECWKQYSTDMFCISNKYYNLPFIKEYLEDYGYPQGENYFDGSYFRGSGDVYSEAIRNLFGTTKYNNAFNCNDNNLLSTPVDICGPTPGGVCAIDDGEAICLGFSDCEIGGEQGNYFGLYYTRELCEGPTGDKRYCFLDKSKSIVDDCYGCSSQMACYDYRTEAACNSDNCGVGYCTWSDVYPELGIGVCADSRYSSCHLCDSEPTQGLGSYLAFDNIFERCTQDKSNALSNPEYPCFFADGKSKSCGDVICADYETENLCTGKGAGFSILVSDNHTILTESSDPCSIGVCQWMVGQCSKNADGNTFPDCPQTNQNEKEKCELDYFPPETDMVPTGSFGIYNEIKISIFDKISYYGEKKGVSGTTGYTTYFCTWVEGAPECNIHDNPFSTGSSQLTMHNRNLMEGQGENITTLSSGTNYFKYYSQDPSNNRGIVREFEIFACDSCTGPSVVNYYVEDAGARDGVYYTSSPNPVIHADFNVEATPLSYAIVDEGGATVSETRYTSDDAQTNFTFTSVDVLPEGQYYFLLLAEDNEGVLMRESLAVPITVDYSAGTVTILIDGEDGEGQLLTGTTASTIDITFDEPVTSFSAYYTANDILRDITSEFSAQDEMTFTASAVELPDGVLTFTAEGYDYSSNLVSGSVEFEVNGRPPYIYIIEPSYGVSEKTTFDLIFGTLNNVDCRYIFDAPIDPSNLPQFVGLTRFDTTGGRTHEKIPFTSISGEANEGNEYEMHVFCNDELHGIAYRTFNLSFDLTNPTIKSATAYPEVIKDQIAENEFETKLTVVTDEEVFCRYATEADAEAEEITNEFPEFGLVARTTNSVFVAVSEDLQAYSYPVLCEDLAGRPTSIEIITFSTDSDQPFTVEGKTQQYYNSRDVLLSLESSKRANCLYGTTQGLYNEFFQESEGYVHSTMLRGLNEGQHSFYVRCDNIYREFKEEVAYANVTFIVDTNPPKMLWVNDTGPIHADPEYTYFTDHLEGQWLGDDSASNITGYRYFVESRYAHEMAKNWTNVVPVGTNVYVASGMNLTQDTTYWFKVRPMDAAGNIGEEMTSDGITVDTTKKPEHCENGFIDNGTETDVDCGGECPGCAEGAACDDNMDCESMFCVEGTCTAPACDDEVQNGLETGVDCGGDCEPCDEGAFCLSNEDCETGVCLNGVCSPENECFNGILDGTETDTDCGGACPTRCSAGNACIEDSDCESPARCIAQVCSVCAEDDFDCDGIPNSQDDDIDGDGIPNWEDPDDDNDGMCDTADSPLNDPEICEEEDDDDDNDGIADEDETDQREYWCYIASEDRAVKGKCEDLGIMGQTIEDGDLDNDGVPNFMDNDADGDGIPDDEDDDDDNDGIPDFQDNDKDGDGIPDTGEDDDLDGMPNDWELANGLNPNDPTDAGLDPDGDGLTNYEEYMMKDKWGQSTDPHSADTDGDGWNDKEEHDAGYNPGDPMFHPESLWWLWLLTVMGVLILLIGGYFGYHAYTTYAVKKAAAPKPRAPPKPVAPTAPAKPKVKEAAPKKVVIKKPEEIKKEKAYKSKFDKIRNIFSKKKEVVKEKETKIVEKEKAKDKEWMALKDIKVKPEPKAKPVEVKIEASPTFQKLQQLKSGSLGKIKGTKALTKLMVRVGKAPEKPEVKKAPATKLFEKIREIRKAAPVMPKIILKPHLGREAPAMPGAKPAEGIAKAGAKAGEAKAGEKSIAEIPKPKIELPAARTPKEAKEQAKAMNAFDKLRVVVQHKDKPRNVVPLSHYTSAERQKLMERLLLLKTGKLKTKHKKELFRKLKITSQSKKAKIEKEGKK